MCSLTRCSPSKLGPYRPAVVHSFLWFSTSGPARVPVLRGERLQLAAWVSFVSWLSRTPLPSLFFHNIVSFSKVFLCERKSFTARTDDGHAAPLSLSGKPFRLTLILLSSLVRFLALNPIEPQPPLLVVLPRQFP